MASYCRCAGEFVNTIQRETFREKVKTFQNIARFVTNMARFPILAYISSGINFPNCSFSMFLTFYILRLLEQALKDC
jgi:glutaredoxin-related protein